MYSPCCVIFLLLFPVNVSCKGTELFIPKTACCSSLLPQSFRQSSYYRNANLFPCISTFRGLSVLLLLCGDMSLNPGTISFGVLSCCSVRNISNIMSTHSVKLLTITGTHIRLTNHGSLPCSMIPVRCKLCHTPWNIAFVVGWLFINHISQFKVVDSPTYMSFENIENKIAILFIF